MKESRGHERVLKLAGERLSTAWAHGSDVWSRAAPWAHVGLGRHKSTPEDTHPSGSWEGRWRRHHVAFPSGRGATPHLEASVLTSCSPRPCSSSGLVLRSFGREREPSLTSIRSPSRVCLRLKINDAPAPCMTAFAASSLLTSTASSSSSVSPQRVMHSRTVRRTSETAFGRASKRVSNWCQSGGAIRRSTCSLRPQRVLPFGGCCSCWPAEPVVCCGVPDNAAPLEAVTMRTVTGRGGVSALGVDALGVWQ
ncbi:hypothetical protein SAMN05421773_1303 [Streptomyces aidingensis]|uniref:Uncharacterized protein n=1 Tax=Streptomyces aidingensis TaxID=910347 RepID=A0A1I1V4I2_9ACTN|nr:hypothetical protein SAMN05421773_1303 [Streptomyces aidingensis]